MPAPLPPSSVSSEKLFIQLVEEGMTGQTAASLLKVLSGGGGFDPTRSVNAEGQNVLEAWWNATGRSRGDRPLPATVQEWVRQYPGIWDRPTHKGGGGRRWSQQILADIIGLDRAQGVGENAVAWLEVMPDSLLTQPLPGRHNGDALKCPADLVAHLLVKEGAAAVLEVLLDRGWALTGSTTSGEPVASFLKTPSQWQRYLEQGGHPDVPVSTHRGEAACPRLPLWEYLRKNGPSVLQERMNQWAAQQRHSDLEKVQDVEYWASLNSYGTAAQIQSRVKVLKNWHQKRDPAGRNVVMALAACRSSSTAIALAGLMKQPKAWSEGTAMGASDKWGRNLWSYLFGSGLLGKDTAGAALGHVPMSVGPRGEGWIHQALVPLPAGKPCLKEHEAGRGAGEAGADWLQSVQDNPDLLWGNTPAAQDELAEWMWSSAPDASMYWGSQRDNTPSSMVVALAKIAGTAPPPPHSPRLLGALALMIACTDRGRTAASNQAVDAFLVQGATMPTQLPEKLQTCVTAWLAPSAKEVLMERFAANQLEQTLKQQVEPPSETVGRSRPRM